MANEHDTLLRVEVKTLIDTVRPGLLAQVADPLWFLSRQWQVELAAQPAAQKGS